MAFHMTNASGGSVSGHGSDSSDDVTPMDCEPNTKSSDDDDDVTPMDCESYTESSDDDDDVTPMDFESYTERIVTPPSDASTEETAMEVEENPSS